MRYGDFELHPGALDAQAQQGLIGEVLAAVEVAPFYQPVTPGGRCMSAWQTSLGPLGWVTDRTGYRYEPLHPLTKSPWPAIPEALLMLWRRFADPDRPPDSCLVNLYRGAAQMGMHQDRDEADLSAPVLGVSLGDTAVFRLGGPSRKDQSVTLKLQSGDINVLAGAARRAYHGVDRILGGSSQLIPGGGRINLTLRRARR